MSTEPLAADPFAAEPAYLASHTALLAEPLLAPLLLDESAKNHKSCIAVVACRSANNANYDCLQMHLLQTHSL